MTDEYTKSLMRNFLVIAEQHITNAKILLKLKSFEAIQESATANLLLANYILYEIERELEYNSQNSWFEK